MDHPKGYFGNEIVTKIGTHPLVQRYQNNE